MNGSMGELERELRRTAHEASVQPPQELPHRIVRAIEGRPQTAANGLHGNGLLTLAASITLMALAIVAAMLVQRDPRVEHHATNTSAAISTTLVHFPQLPQTGIKLRLDEPLVREVRMLARNAELKYVQ